MSDTAIFITPDERMVILNDNPEFKVLPDSIDVVITVPATGMRGSRIVEIGISMQGPVFADEVPLRHELANPTTILPDLCKASCDTPAEVTVIFTIKLDNTIIGYVTFLADSFIGTFNFPALTGPIGPGILRIIAPAITSTLAEASITISGDR